MDDQTTGADAPEEQAVPPLRDEIRELLFGLPAKELAAFTQLRDHQEQADADGAFVKVSRQALDEVIAFMADPDHAGLQANAIMHLLNERGHYLPGCPPAAQILQDAQQFAGQFMLAMLCVRLLRMLNTRIVTPETKGMERWLNDYIDGKNHGPVGKPMFWPGGLPGLAQQLRQWGYAPTETRPQFVARARPESVMTMQ